jgi:ribokinase
MSDLQPRLCVVGSLNMDLVFRVPRLPAPGETITGGPAETHPGGKGANQAVAAARLGAAVTMVGRVGDDEPGRRLRAALAAERVDVQHVLPTPGVGSGAAAVTVAAAGENTIVIVPGANAKLTPADIDSHRYAITSADVLVMQLETPMDAVARAARAAREAGVTVILNAAPASELPADLLACVDVLVVNECEAATLTRSAASADADQDAEMLRRLARLPVGTVVLTVGSRGSWVGRAESLPTRAEPFQVRVVDTVGAGDAFIGAFAVRWAAQQVSGGVDDVGLLDCLCWANAAGALAATRHGAIPSLPSRAEVVALLRRAGREEPEPLA